MIENGAVLGGKYRVLAMIGQGGMGAVYRAENMLTGKQVALKCLHPQLRNGAEATERLLREARAVSNLSHPNVVDVYDVMHDGERLFLVMELLHGETLRDYLAREPHPEISGFIALLLPAVSGVAAAHERGVIHRDLKPDNIFLERVSGSSKSVAKVLDFGIAKMAAVQGQTLTQTGTALGTPLYMSLEQLRGDKDVDARADVYAFGVMLYQAITGRMPFEATTLSELAIKVATTDAAPVKSLRPDVPTSLARVIDWAIARDKKQRLPDLKTLRQELEVFARDHSFRDQMTNPEAAIPRLLADVRADRAQALPPLGAAQPAGLADTMRARETVLRRSQSGKQWSFWLIGAGALVGVGVFSARFVGERGHEADSTQSDASGAAIAASPREPGNAAVVVPAAQGANDASLGGSSPNQPQLTAATAAQGPSKAPPGAGPQDSPLSATADAQGLPGTGSQLSAAAPSVSKAQQGSALPAAPPGVSSQLPALAPQMLGSGQTSIAVSPPAAVPREPKRVPREPKRVPTPPTAAAKPAEARPQTTTPTMKEKSSAELIGF